MLVMLFIRAPMPAHAAETGTNVWIRARISYESDGTLEGLSDEMFTLSSSDWQKKDGWYYYGKPVEPGRSVDFIKGVQIPYSWNNSVSGKSFSIVVKVEAAEAFPGDPGWNEGSSAVYSGTFDFSKQNAESGGISVRQGNIRIRLEEYQEINGKEQPYENNRIVIPGEKVSKIVRITVDGEKSKLSPAEMFRNPVKTGDDSRVALLLLISLLIILLLAVIGRGGKGGDHGGRTPALA